MDPRLAALPDIHGHAKGEHKPFADERPIPYTARVIFLWFYHAAMRRSPRFMMVSDHINYLTFEDPAAVNLVRRALRLANAGDLYGAAETAGVDIAQAQAVSEALRSGSHYTIGVEVDNDPRSRPDAPNVVDAMKPDGIIRSIHFLPIDDPKQSEDFLWPFDNPEFIHYYDTVGTEKTWELYINALVEAISTLPTHIVGHLYVPAKFGHWPAPDRLEAYENQILDICLERGIAIEINMRIFYRSDNEELKEQHYQAYRRLLQKAKERGVAIALGSDAHSPKDQGNAFDRILPLLDELHINELAFPVGGRLARVALRVEKPTKQSTRPTATEKAEHQPPRKTASESKSTKLPNAELAASIETIAIADRPPEHDSLAIPSGAEPVAASVLSAVSHTSADAGLNSMSSIEHLEPAPEAREASLDSLKKASARTLKSTGNVTAKTAHKAVDQDDNATGERALPAKTKKAQSTSAKASQSTVPSAEAAIADKPIHQAAAPVNVPHTTPPAKSAHRAAEPHAAASDTAPGPIKAKSTARAPKASPPSKAPAAGSHTAGAASRTATRPAKKAATASKAGTGKARPAAAAVAKSAKAKPNAKTSVAKPKKPSKSLIHASDGSAEAGSAV